MLYVCTFVTLKFCCSSIRDDNVFWKPYRDSTEYIMTVFILSSYPSYYSLILCVYVCICIDLILIRHKYQSSPLLCSFHPTYSYYVPLSVRVWNSRQQTVFSSANTNSLSLSLSLPRYLVHCLLVRFVGVRNTLGIGTGSLYIP